MKKNIFIPAALLAAITFYACGGENKETAKIDPDSIEWVTLEAHEKYTDPELIEAFPDDSLGYTFQADYKLLLPKTNDGSEHAFLKTVTLELMSRVDTLTSTTEETPEEFLKQYVRGKLDNHKTMVRSLLPDLGDIASPYQFIEEHSLTDSLVYNHNGIVSIISRWYAFTGGAHGNYGDAGWTFDFIREVILSQKDLFKDGTEKEINSLLLETLMKDRGVTDTNVLKDSLYIDADRVVMNDNFYFDGDGITYIYQPYEIAPYSEGQSLVHLPFMTLAPYLRDEYASLAR